METFTRESFTGYIIANFGEYAAQNLTVINKWLTRGDGAAVYVNSDLGHGDLGRVQVVSYGSPAAQLEPRCKHCQGTLTDAGEHTYRSGEPVYMHADGTHEDHFPELGVYPPVTLPDFGGAINWRYQLHGTYRGDPLTVPELPCEVDDCKRPGEPCDCGNAHCPVHPHIYSESEDDEWEDPAAWDDGEDDPSPYDTSDPYDKEYDVP